MASAMSDAQKKEALAQIANVSKFLREAIAASLPVAPEQYLSIAIPGTTIDTREIRDGGTFVWDAKDGAFAPSQVQQAEARLVDNMVPLSYVMIGNTGKSVSRSYARALDCLVSRTANIETGGDGVGIRSPGSPEYKDAMQYLTTPDKNTGRTVIDLYVEKQAAWAAAQTEWDQAKIQAKKDAERDFSRDPVKQIQAFNDWNQANYRKFKFAVQGRYMDWIANGYKYAVEANFGIVDVDSIMARVEQSKESLRNSTVVDADGSNEVQLVNLTPKNWATLCKLREEGWYARNGDYTLEQIDAEIERLNRLIISYRAMATNMGLKIDTDGTVTVDPNGKQVYPLEPGAEPTKPGDADTTLQTSFSDMYAKQAAVANENKLLQGKSRQERADAEKDDTKGLGKAIKELNEERGKLNAAIRANQAAHSDYTKWAVTTMSNSTNNQNAITSWIKDTLATLTSNIAKLEKKREVKANQQLPQPPVITGATANDDGTTGDPNGTDVAAAGDTTVAPRFGLNDADPASGSTGGSGTGTGTGTSKPANTDLPVAGSTSDPWVTISASFSAQEQSSLKTESSWGVSVGGGAGWGLWSVGGSYSHDQSSSDFSSDMSSCDVSVSFACMVVNVGRPWLYGELFSDAELDVPNGIKLSPGANYLKDWMQNQSTNKSYVDKLQDYSMFPAYPTSFVVAADTTIEFHGNTQHIEKHFSSESNSGSASVGWGPFSVSSSFHQSSSRESFQMQSTATGCRLTFGAPQVIGWVSQILPALPRLKGYAPMVQNLGEITL